MIALDEDSLICDFAETYHVMDFRSLPAQQAAVLACGLRADSRIMQRISGLNTAPSMLLLGTIADALKILVWQNTKDGAKGKNRPDSILSAMLGEEEKPKTGEIFDTADDFKAWRDAMLNGGQTNG